MSKSAYHLQLKGYVGGSDFDRSKVDKTLAENSGKQVYVLIDSLSGSLATGLSISAAFKNHGNVNMCISSDSMPLPQQSLRSAQLTSPLTQRQDISCATHEQEEQIRQLRALRLIP